MNKESIDIYSPTNKWERAIQDAAKMYTGSHLSSYHCQLLAKTIFSLRCDNSWELQEELLPIRASYLFAPHLINNKDKVIFVTHMLFLRDILENNQINCQLHAPIAFVTPPLAHFLFQQSLVHIWMNKDLLRAYNRNVRFVDIGGLIIVEDQSVELNSDIVQNIVYRGEQQDIKNLTKTMESDWAFSKIAVHTEVNEFGEEMLFQTKHYPDIQPDASVWDKVARASATVTEVEPSENGLVKVQYKDGREESISKESFDQQFVLV